MRGEFSPTGLDSVELIELFLKAIGVAPGKLLIASALGFCFACREYLLLAAGTEEEGSVPFFIAFALSALR